MNKQQINWVAASLSISTQEKLGICVQSNIKILSIRRA